MISRRVWLSPGQFLIFGLFVVTFIGRVRRSLKEWFPVILFILGYEFLRGLISYVGKNVNILPMINVDKSIFGFVPTVKLQSLLYNPTRLAWYDYLATLFYVCHVITPAIVGYYFWLKDKVFFSKFAFAFLVLSYAGFITYIIFPAMPPWIAGSLGYLPHVTEIAGVVLSHFFRIGIVSNSVVSLLDINSVAAMPSLHAAFPLMVFFFLFKWSKKAGVFFIPYVLGVWFSVIYLGAHYFIDVVMGVVYSIVVFLTIEVLGKKYLNKS
jgi:membrane-associated phospholipid phosphatase